jgi:multicomponent Na+:H+ antiporter subunit D
MRDLLVALPVAIPLTGAALCITLWRRLRLQRIAALAAGAALVAVAIALVLVVWRDGPLHLAVGGWAAPVGIELRADMLAALLVLVSAVLGLAVIGHALVDVPGGHAAHGFWPLVLLLLMGVCGALLTGDLFNLYVWFEVMLIASFVLLGLGGRRAQLRGALIYVTLNLIASSLLLIGVGLTYAATRTLDFTQLAARLAELAAARPEMALAIQALLLTALGIKAAVFPLFFWLPASYHTPPPAVSALFAGLLTKVAVYAMIRVTAGVFPTPDALYTALAVIGAATMITGVLGALAQREVRRILSVHIVSQIGYMVAGLALATGSGPERRFALAATIFYVLHNILVKANLFLVAGVIRRVRGTESLDRLGGLARAHPALAAIFLVSALSLAGLPPLSGFWAKLAIFEAALGAERYLLLSFAVVTSLLTLLSMLKIWIEAFAGEARAAPLRIAHRTLRLQQIPAAALAVLILAIGLWPEPLLRLCALAAAHLAPDPPAVSALVGGAP